MNREGDGGGGVDYVAFPRSSRRMSDRLHPLRGALGAAAGGRRKTSRRPEGARALVQDR